MLKRTKTIGPTVDPDPFVNSLWGECTRVLLVGTSGCSCLFWGTRLQHDSAALLMVSAYALIALITVSANWLRLFMLVPLSVVILKIAAIYSSDQGLLIWSPFAMFSPAFAVGSTLLLLSREVWITVGWMRKTMTLRRLFILGAVLLAVVYMVVIPSLNTFWQTNDEMPQHFVVEELTAFEILRVRSAKLAVFSVFVFAGACIGSFLNVAAYCIPRGEPFLIRSSACPGCKTPIQRVDNIPLFSYLRLRGKCRHCELPIPARYFMVELTGMVIFGLLFLTELVTGAANVPGFRPYTHVGIVWMILYAKWGFIGIYALHCVFFSGLLTLALIEQDRCKPPKWLRIGLWMLAAILVVASPNLLPVPLFAQTPIAQALLIPDWAGRGLHCLFGALIGWLVSRAGAWNCVRTHQSTNSLLTAFVLVGMTLGWQAVTTIAFFWLVAGKGLRELGGLRVRPRWLTTTTLLLIIALLHHPVWSWLASHLSL